MDQNVVFKTATVGGFEKRAVLDYIYKMNEDIETERAELLARIAQLENSESSDNEKSQSFDQNFLNMENNLVNTNKDLSDERDKTSALERERRELKQKIEELEKENEKLKTEKDSYVDNSKYRELEAKRDEIEKVSYQVGRVMLDARADADHIMQEAKEEARKSREKAELDASEVTTKAKNEADSTLKISKEAAEKELVEADREKIRILKEANETAESRVKMAKKESEKIMSEMQGRIKEIVSTSRIVSVESQSKLNELENESNRIKETLDKAFDMLKEKTDTIHSAIVAAKRKINTEQESISEAKLLDVANMTRDELKDLEAVFAPKIQEETVPEPEVTIADISGDYESKELISEVAVFVQTDDFEPSEIKPIEDIPFKSGIFSKDGSGAEFENQLNLETTDDQEQSYLVGVESGLLDSSNASSFEEKN